MTGASTLSALLAVRPLRAKFVGDLVAGLYAEIIRFDDVRGISNADGKRTPRLDVLHGLVGFGEIQSNGVPRLHRSPSSIHDIHAAILVISCNHQNRHRENAFGDFQFCSHDNFSL